jgi:hypothetical protein
MANEAPILLQRGCGVEFRVRTDSDAQSAPQATLEDALEVVRSLPNLQPHERVWIDLFMTYEGLAMNEEAKNRAGQGEVRRATWEIVGKEVIFCPAIHFHLDPKMLAFARELAS